MERSAQAVPEARCRSVAAGNALSTIPNYGNPQPGNQEKRE